MPGRVGNAMVGFLVGYLVKDLKRKDARLSIIYQEGEMGEQALKGLEESEKFYGLKVVAKELYKRGAIDFSSQVFNLRKENPDVVIIQAVTRETAAILSEMKKIEWNPIKMALAATMDAKMLELAGDAAEGLYTSHSYEQPDPNKPGSLAMIERIKKYSPGTEISIYSTTGYISGMIMVEGLKRAGRELTREKLVAALESIKDWDPDGLSPGITYGKDNRIPIKSGAVFKVDLRNKTFVRITDWIKPGWVK